MRKTGHARTLIRAGFLSVLFGVVIGASSVYAEAVRTGSDSEKALIGTISGASALPAAALADGTKSRAARSPARTSSRSSASSSRSTSSSRSSASSTRSSGRSSATSSSRSSSRSAVRSSGSSSRTQARTGKSYPRRNSVTSTGTRHHSRPGHRRGYRHGSRYYYNHGYGHGYYYGSYPYYGIGHGPYGYWPGFYLSWGYGPGLWWGAPYHYPYRYFGYYASRDSGAIDLNVKPKKTKVYLNGHYVGETGKYDGWPEYLWLPEGKHELIFHLDGHQTERRVYNVTAGIVLRERFNLSAGDPTAVAELSDPPKRERRAESRRYATYRRGAERSMADHPRAKRRYEAPEGELAPLAKKQDLRAQPARASFVILPADASVYLDGKLVGSAEELQQGDKILLDAGEHVLEVIRPGYISQKRTFSVESGKTVNLDITLEKE